MPEANVTADPVNIQPQASPVTGQLQPPADAPAPTPVPTQAQIAPPKPGSVFRNVSHSLMGGILGSLAGAPQPNYDVNDTGTTVAQPQGPDSSTSKLKRIAQAALIGLAAGSKADTALGGLGAGGEAVIKNNQQQDLSKRKEAEDIFDREQQVLLRKHEIARSNALTFSTTLGNIKTGNDLNPQYAANEELFNAVKASPELGAHAQIMTEPQLEDAYGNQATSGVSSTSHIILPLGRAPVTGPDGKPVFEADGVTPETTMRYAVIDGTKDGQIAVTPSMAADFKKYAPMLTNVSGDIANIKAGDTYPIDKILPALNSVSEAKKKELDGWVNAKPVLVQGKDDKGKPTETIMQMNPNLPQDDPNKVKPYPNGVPIEVQKQMEDIKKIRLEEQKSREEIESLRKMGVNAPPGYVSPPSAFNASQGDLSNHLIASGVTVPPDFASLYAVGHYDADLNKIFNPRGVYKGTVGKTADDAETYIRNFVNPNFDHKVYTSLQKLETSFMDTNSQAGKSIVAFNTAAGHLGQLRQAAAALQNGDLIALNRIAQAYGYQTGKSAPVVYKAIVNGLAGEIDKTFKGGAGDIPGTSDIKQTLLNTASPQAMDGVTKAYSRMMLSKAEEMGNFYYANKGYYPSALISPHAQEVYKGMGFELPPVGTPVGRNQVMTQPQGGITNPGQGTPVFVGGKQVGTSFDGGKSMVPIQ